MRPLLGLLASFAEGAFNVDARDMTTNPRGLKKVMPDAGSRETGNVPRYAIPYISAHVYKYIYAFAMLVCMNICMYECMHVCMYACMHVCMYRCICCTCICMHISSLCMDAEH